MCGSVLDRLFPLVTAKGTQLANVRKISLLLFDLFICLKDFSNRLGVVYWCLHESGGWASVATQRLNVGVWRLRVILFPSINVSKSVVWWFFRKLTNKSSEKVYKNWSAHVKNNQAMADKLQDLTNFLKATDALKGLTEEAATQVVQSWEANF